MKICTIYFRPTEWPGPTMTACSPQLGVVLHGPVLALALPGTLAGRVARETKRRQMTLETPAKAP